MTVMDRRRFLGALPAISAGAACGLALGAGACTGFRYVTAAEAQSRLMVRRDSFEGFPDVLVESTRTPRPIYLREIDADSYSAVMVRCTHRGCQPEPEADRLVCPCHGSEFTFQGVVLQGPAERPLTSFEVTIDGPEISIWLDRRENG